jgi:diacylglycerol kinase
MTLLSKIVKLIFNPFETQNQNIVHCVTILLIFISFYYKMQFAAYVLLFLSIFRIIVANLYNSENN